MRREITVFVVSSQYEKKKTKPNKQLWVYRLPSRLSMVTFYKYSMLMLKVFPKNCMLVKTGWSRALWIYRNIYWVCVLHACVAASLLYLTGYTIWLFVVTQEYLPETLKISNDSSCEACTWHPRYPIQSWLWWKASGQQTWV